MQRLAHGWLVLCLLGAAHAQDRLAMSHQAWSTGEGLPDASVHQVLQTRDGYLWLATERGAARFDGFTFKIFRHDTEPSFTSDDVSSVVEDTAGHIWFGTADGLIERRGEAFRRFTQQDGLPSSQILAIAAAGDGSVMALTAGGLAYLKGDAVQQLPSSLPAIRAVEAIGDGTVRLFTTGADTFQYTHGAFSRERRFSALPGPLVGEQSGRAGALWLRTVHEVATVLPSASGLRKVWPVTPDQARLRVTALLVDAQGQAWIGTSHGLFLELPNAGATPVAVDPLRNESILTLATDREADLWIGTEASGLHVLRPRAFRSEEAASGEAVTAVLGAGGGTVWFGTRNNGVESVLPNNTMHSIAVGQLASTRVLSLARGLHGDLWVGTPDGLNRVPAIGKIETYTSADGLPDDFVRSVLVDRDGTVWAGTRRGLARLDHGRISVLTSADGLPSDSIGPLLVDASGSGDLWVGTSNGLAVLRNGQVAKPTGAIAAGAIVTALLHDGRDGLWIGVYGKGLFYWHAGQLAQLKDPRLPLQITDLASDRQGYLWTRDPQGIHRASMDGLRACAQRGTRCVTMIDSFGVADGMPSDSLAAEGTPQIADGPRDELWFSTRKGIAVAVPAHLPLSHVPPPVVVQRLTVDGVDVDDEAGQARVGPGHSRYVFDYAALSYRLPSRVRYRYRLDGFDRDWVDAGTARSAYYTSLGPGRYTFRVLAETGDGLWSSPGASLRLEVVPALYRRWWFYLLLLLLSAALFVAALRLRDRAVQRRFALVLNERNRMAREIHDTLAQDFVSVSLQLDVAAAHLRGKRFEEAASQLQATRTLVKDGLREARQSIWNLRANAGEDSLPTRLSALVARYSFGGSPAQLTIGGAFRKIAPRVEDEVLRIAGESLSNVNRHAGATKVVVELRYNTDALMLKVCDDGQGFSPEAALHAEGRYGVRGMHERAATLGAELRMVSSPGQGATVTLRVPLRDGEVNKS